MSRHLEYCKIPTFVQHLFNFMRGNEWILMCQKRMEICRFKSLMKMKCLGRALASTCVLICYNGHIWHSTSPLLIVQSGASGWCGCNQTVLSKQSSPRSHILPVTDRRLIKIRSCIKKWHFFSLSGRFAAVIFSLFVFGQRQQIDDAVTEWHCILGSQDHSHKSMAIQPLQWPTV